MKLQTKGRVACAASAEVDGDIFSFRGGSTGVVKILEPMSPLLNYFEYLILDRGQEASIGIGVGERSYPTGRMPGWNRNGCGYHADDGKLYHENGLGRAFGPTCTNGDRMGCGVDFDADCGPDHVNIFFTKNGKQVGDPIRMKKPVHGLYPLVGLHSRGERVHYLGHWQRTADGSTEPMEQDHSPSTAWLRCNQVRFLDDGLTVEYAGQGGDVQDIGMAQASEAGIKDSWVLSQNSCCGVLQWDIQWPVRSDPLVNVPCTVRVDLCVVHLYMKTFVRGSVKCLTFRAIVWSRMSS